MLNIYLASTCMSVVIARVTIRLIAGAILCSFDSIISRTRYSAPVQLLA